MNRSFIVSIALAITLVGTASARPVFQYIRHSTQMPRAASGAVTDDGIIFGGTGFTVTHPMTGVYNIKFSKGFWPSGCAAMVVQPRSPGLSYVRPLGCAGADPTFYVRFFDPKTGALIDKTFDFIAVED